MSVWISDEKLLIFASLISPSKMILFEKKYQTFDTVFHHQMKHLEVRQKYSAARRIFNSLLGVSSGDETLRLMFDILHKKLSGRWIVIYPVDSRYPTFRQMYGARSLRCSLPRVYTSRLVMFLLHNINSTYFILAILKHPFCGKIRYFGRLSSLLLSIYFI